MALRNATAVYIPPSGVSDSADGTKSFKGSMKSLQNLIPDPSTEGLFVPRPASYVISSFPGFSSPGFISVVYQLGDILYGMIQSALNTGKEQPFSYNIVANTFNTFSGITGANTPSNAATTGDWTPPTMALIAAKIIVTHPGFSGSNFIGIINVATPASPAWSAGNTATNALPSVPTCVQNFSGRAYYACGNVLYYSDVLVPTTITNASQSLTLGDSSPVVALQTLGLTSTTIGGVVSSLMAFKNSNIFQITGDAALSTLSMSPLSVGVGTYSPLSVIPTPHGLAFIAPDGLRVMDFSANVSDPIGAHGTGVCVTFTNVVYPSRICSSFNQNTIRVSVTTKDVTGFISSSEYWFDMKLNIWTGPHNFPAALIVPYKKTFLMVAIGINAKIFQSDTIPISTSVYTENSVAMNFDYECSLLPDTGQMQYNAVIEASIGLAFLTQSGEVTFAVLDENQVTISQVSMTQMVFRTIWGSFIWGAANWSGSGFGYQQVKVPFDVPIVFRQAFINVTGSCIAGLKLGSIFLRYQSLGYMA